MFVTPAYAQTSAAGPDMLVSILPFILIFVIMYFLLYRRPPIVILSDELIRHPEAMLRYIGYMAKIFPYLILPCIPM